VSERPFKILGLQQIAVGGLDKAALRRFWIDTLGLTATGTYRAEKENVDEDIAVAGAGPFKVEVDLMQPIAEDLAEAGVAAWNIEFKRWKPGEEGVWMDTLSDVLRAWGQLALLPGIDITRSMVMGHSAGGQLALLMSAKAERRPWLAIAQAPLTDLIGADHARLSDDGDAVRRWIGCAPEENETVWGQLNPVDHPPRTSVLLFHGEDDVDVPLEQSETYARVMKAKGADVQKVWLPGDHYDIIDVASDDWLVQLNTILDWL